VEIDLTVSTRFAHLDTPEAARGLRQWQAEQAAEKIARAALGDHPAVGSAQKNRNQRTAIPDFAPIDRLSLWRRGIRAMRKALGR
jgi:hypothetical protein